MTGGDDGRSNGSALQPEPSTFVAAPTSNARTVRLADPGPIHDGLRRAERRRRSPAGRGRDAKWARRSSATGPSGCAREVFRRHKPAKASMWSSCRGGKCSMPSSPALRPITVPPSHRRHRADAGPQRRPRRPRRCLVALRAYKVIVVSRIFAGGVPIHADLRRLRAPRRSAPTGRCVASGSRAPAGTLPAVGRPRLRSRPAAVISTHGTQGLHRRSACRSSFCTRTRPISRRRRRTRRRPARSPPAAATAAVAPAAAPAPAAPAADAGGARAGVGAGRDARPREITVETATVRVVFTNRGARVLRWQLKDYRDTGGQLVDLVPSGLPDERAASVLAAGGRRARKPHASTRAIYRVTGDRRRTSTRRAANRWCSSTRTRTDSRPQGVPVRAERHSC